MKEHGQPFVLVSLIAIFVLAALFFLMAGNSRGVYEGANAIGDAVGDNIDNLFAIEQAVGVWAGPQRGIYPNKHAIERHGTDAYATTDCYNRNGTFHVMSTKFDGIHLLCREDDGTIRDMILQQRGKSNEFDFNNAFTPQGGKLRDILDWIRRKPGAGKFKMPENSTIYIDGIAP